MRTLSKCSHLAVVQHMDTSWCAVSNQGSPDVTVHFSSPKSSLWQAAKRVKVPSGWRVATLGLAVADDGRLMLHVGGRPKLAEAIFSPTPDPNPADVPCGVLQEVVWTAPSAACEPPTVEACTTSSQAVAVYTRDAATHALRFLARVPCMGATFGTLVERLVPAGIPTAQRQKYEAQQHFSVALVHDAAAAALVPAGCVHEACLAADMPYSGLCLFLSEGSDRLKVCYNPAAQTWAAQWPAMLED